MKVLPIPLTAERGVGAARITIDPRLLTIAVIPQQWSEYRQVDCTTGALLGRISLKVLGFI